jgi:hypothetical protein
VDSGAIRFAIAPYSLAINEIEAVWRSRALATSKRDRAYATVQVWGRH